MATLQRMLWWKVPCSTLAFWKSWISTILSCHSKHQTCRWPLKHIRRQHRLFLIHYTSALPRQERVLRHNQKLSRHGRTALHGDWFYDAYLAKCRSVEEIKVARDLLKTFGLISNAATLISCPTCGRLDIDLFSIANEVEEYISKLKVPIKVSVLGCAVNGQAKPRKRILVLPVPVEKVFLFRHGKMIRKVPEEIMVEELKKKSTKLSKRMKKQGLSLDVRTNFLCTSVLQRNGSYLIQTLVIRLNR